MTPQMQKKPIGGIAVEPAVPQDKTDENPTAIRYGWNPYPATIRLTGPDGTIALYVQPHEIVQNGQVVDNPYHREIPKGQLIPFPSFPAVQFTLSEDLKDSKGAAMPVRSVTTISALDAMRSILRVYSGKGFTMLRSLQGLDQSIANRIFRIVHPFEYTLGELEFELTVGAEARINSISDLKFTLDDGSEYVVPALQSDEERAIATQLAGEMAAGADVARTMAEDIFEETNTQIKGKLSGAKEGKVAPDKHDREIAAELGREFINLATVTGGPSVPEDLKKNVEFLVDREVSRADKEEIARLREENERLRSGTPAVSSPEGEATATVTAGADDVPPKAPSNLQKTNVTECGRRKSNGEPCRTITRDGAACYQHAEEGEEEEEAAEPIAA